MTPVLVSGDAFHLVPRVLEAVHKAGDYHAAITLSFAFYILVALWAHIHPAIGMFMLPKTCMYIWIVWMGYKESTRFCP